MADKTLDDMLTKWTVLPPGTWDNDQGPSNWYAVANDQGIVAYFGDESDAFRHRLAAINRELNG